MAHHLTTVFGGSGFIGRHLVQRLAAQGGIVRVAVRDPEAAAFLKTMGDAGQIVPVGIDVTNPTLVTAAVAGADTVVNLVGILYERGRRTFERLHVEATTAIARAAADAGVARLVQMSAIGADENAEAAYARTKAAGERAVMDAFPEATIVRPSVVFGPEDHFFNLLAGMARLSWVLPVLGCPVIPKIRLFAGDRAVAVDLYGDGGTKFQPVYVGDVGDAIMAILANPETGGKTYELGGPRVYSFKQIMELVLHQTRRRRLLLPVPLAIAAMQAWFLELLPVPPLTRDQVKLLAHDNVVSAEALGMQDLGINPMAAEAILPTYLHRFRPPTLQKAHA